MCTRVRYIPAITSQLLGAEYLTILRSPDKSQLLFIFGETHNIYQESNCEIKPEIILIQYLISVIGNNFYDIFIELPYTRGSKQPYIKRPKTSQIYAIDDFLNTCSETLECDLKFRLHYSDARSMKSRAILRDLNRVNSSSNESDFITSIGNLGTTISILFSGEYTTDKVIDIFGLKSKVEIEIGRFHNKYVNEAKKLQQLYDHTYNNLLSITEYISKLMTYITSYISNPDMSIRIMISKLVLYITFTYFTVGQYSEARLMDIYTLARIFHQFKISDESKSNVTHGIFYGGSAHSEFITNFLIESGYTQLFHNESASGCISVPKYPSLI